MEQVIFVKFESFGETIEHAIINRGNGEYTSMPKSVYDEQQAALFTPIVKSDGE